MYGGLAALGWVTDLHPGMLQVVEVFLDQHRVFGAGNNRDWPATGLAGLNVT